MLIQSDISLSFLVNKRNFIIKTDYNFTRNSVPVWGASFLILQKAAADEQTTGLRELDSVTRVDTPSEPVHVKD